MLTHESAQNTHKVAEMVICLPMHHALNKDDLDRIVEYLPNKVSFFLLI